jgi:protein-S-isoprenylcysteine O-methyltransferase Ste14
VPLSSAKDLKGDRNWIRSAVGFGLFLLLLPAALMVSAGTLAWPMGWVLVVFILVSTVVSRLIALRKFPDLLKERGSYTTVEGVKPWDRVIVSSVGLIGPLVTFLVAGLDHRYAWPPPVSIPLTYLALLLVVLGFGVGVWAMAVNRFFSAVVRFQHERGHHVVDQGPYRWIRHPSYAGAVLAYLAIPLMLDACWALVPGSLMCAAVIVRTHLEDQTLLQELPGYPEYARRTPFRLLPGIW